MAKNSSFSAFSALAGFEKTEEPLAEKKTETVKKETASKKNEDTKEVKKETVKKDTQKKAPVKKEEKKETAKEVKKETVKESAKEIEKEVKAVKEVVKEEPVETKEAVNQELPEVENKEVLESNLTEFESEEDELINIIFSSREEGVDWSRLNVLLKPETMLELNRIAFEETQKIYGKTHRKVVVSHLVRLAVDKFIRERNK
ncbi:MAG: hypothetical protein K6F84_00145 [Lachnospiraceae bacterium]|nr:hypothetical protein [Lachnospiraceae bacterium]